MRRMRMSLNAVTDFLLDDLAAGTPVLADKAYDSNAIRDLIERQSAPPTSSARSTSPPL